MSKKIRDYCFWQIGANGEAKKVLKISPYGKCHFPFFPFRENEGIKKWVFELTSNTHFHLPKGKKY